MFTGLFKVRLLTETLLSSVTVRLSVITVPSSTSAPAAGTEPPYQLVAVFQYPSASTPHSIGGAATARMPVAGLNV